MLILSLIIPVYNGKDTIVTTLRSIANTLPKYIDLKHIEIIIVNDGSNDSTEKLVKNFIENNSLFNFQYLYQENQGISVARNFGLDSARGEYVWFFDGDDILIDDGLPSIFKYMMARDIEVISFRNRTIINSKLTNNLGCDFPVSRNRNLSGIESLKQGYLPSSACCLIIKREVFYANSIFFYPGITHQDVELTARLMITVRRVVFIEAIPYGYVHMDNSVSKSKNKNKLMKYCTDNIIVAKSLHDFSSSLDIVESKLIDNIVNNIVWNYIINLYLSKKDIDKTMLKTLLDTLFFSNVYPITGPMQTSFQSLTKNFFNNRLFLKTSLYVFYKF